MCSLVKSNLDLCRIEGDETEVVQAEAHHYLRRALLQQRGSFDPWDIVFFDPPYAMDYLPILEVFGAQTSSLLTPNGLLIVEHHHKKLLPEEIRNIRRARALKQGDSALSFYEVSGS